MFLLYRPHTYSIYFRMVIAPKCPFGLHNVMHRLGITDFFRLKTLLVEPPMAFKERFGLRSGRSLQISNSLRG